MVSRDAITMKQVSMVTENLEAHFLKFACYICCVAVASEIVIDYHVVIYHKFLF